MALSKGRSALSEKQAEMDVDKWLKSEQAGRDMCGEFAFCSKCNKDDENPCAKAYEAMKKENIAALKAEKENAVSTATPKATKKTVTKTASAKKSAGTKTEKKTTAKKTAAKK